MKKISVVGLGYIGLPTAILAAQSGYKVFGFDVDHQKVEKINNGDCVILEPEISNRLYSVLINKSFKAYTQLQEADCFVIAVPTPFKKENTDIKKADLSYVFSAAEIISQKLSPGNLVILESTVPVGTTHGLAKFLEEKTGLKLGIDFFVSHCPERVLPGKIFKELVLNDRVIGGTCEQSCELSAKFYTKFVKGNLIFTDDKTAEMVKLVENSSRDVQIAFANQVDAMCAQAGINSYQVIEIANKHPRVNILNPGCGVGGHCIAVDPWFLIESFDKNSNLLLTSRRINDSKPDFVINSVLNKAKKLKSENHDQVDKKVKVLALGLTFKPDVDDLRESPALDICKKLLNYNNLIDLTVCEPNIKSEILDKLGFIDMKNLAEGIIQADIVLILVSHKEFFTIKELDLKSKEIIDTCGLLYKTKPNNEKFLFFDKSVEKQKFC